ncbi:MAG: hypothetical protein JSU68_07190, partial [Phycisphaerales bacterium]
MPIHYSIRRHGRRHTSQKRNRHIRLHRSGDDPHVLDNQASRPYVSDVARRRWVNPETKRRSVPDRRRGKHGRAIGTIRSIESIV